MRRVVGTGARRTIAGKSTSTPLALDDRPLGIVLSRDGKRAVVALPYELWVVHATTLEFETTIELPFPHPAVAAVDDEGQFWIGGQHLRRGSLFSPVSTKVGTKLGGFVDQVCTIRARILCGIGTHGEILWDSAKEQDVHRRKADHVVYALAPTADGRALWADGSSHAWVIDPDHPAGYMKLKLKATSPGEEEHEAITLVALGRTGANLLAARDGAVAWTNRGLRIVQERVPAARSVDLTPLAIDADEQWVYVLRPNGVLHRFLVAQPLTPPGAKEAPAELPWAQETRLSRVPTCLALGHDGHLLLAGPQFDDQLGRLWREEADALPWEELRLGQRTLVEPAPAPEEPPAPGSRKPDFTPTKHKPSGPPIGELRVDDVLAATPKFWVTRRDGSLLERPTTILPEEEVLGGDALLLPAMFRTHEGTARPGLVLWPGVPDARPLLPVTWITWGDDPRGWLPLETPAIREQGWSRREVFPLQVALPHPPPACAGRRPKLPAKWTDPELFEALARECKKLLKVLW